jgi:hypothetical protein
MFRQKRVSNRLAELALGRLILPLDHPRTYGLGRCRGELAENEVSFLCSN